MSVWYDSKDMWLDDDGESVNIYVFSDENGAIYVTVKKEDVLNAKPMEPLNPKPCKRRQNVKNTAPTQTTMSVLCVSIIKLLILLRRY